MTKQWSDNTVTLTREAIFDCFVAPDGVLHMKNFNNSFGAIQFENLVENRLLIKDKETQSEFLYGTVEELIAAGWVID